MEKLQAALDRARKARSDGKKTSRASVTQGGSSGGSDLEENWMQLQEISPDLAALERNRVVSQIANARATPFDILRTKIFLQMRQNNWKRLAITSPMPKSGKTTTACNLALGFGRQRDLRSMLLDLDLRDPSVSTFFNVMPERGINDVLTGELEFHEQAMRVGTNVAVSMAKQRETDPTRVLLSEEAADVIDDIEAEYQPNIMIFDLPSLLINDDTRAFLKNVDCALIVARADKTRNAQFDRTEREIAEQTNVLGVVLNAYRDGKPGQDGS
ncbi:MAG: CpsD/CapB family tyrosine-protein kinase [Pseudomonadota bacterium]